VTSINWREALAEHDRWLRAVAYARVRESQAVDDVIQEVALAAVKTTSPPKPEKIAPWLYRLTVRQALLYRRSCGRMRKRHQQAADSQLEPMSEPDPLSWLMADEQRKQIRLALDQLPQRDAEILLLKYTENWSYRQIAEKLDVTEAAIESRLHRARKKLRAQLFALQVIEAPR